MHKTFRFSVKAAGTDTDDAGAVGHIEVIGACYGNVDLGNDRLVKGCFADSIKELRARAQERGRKYVLPILHEHTPGEQLGGWISLTETNEGLLCKGDLLLSIPKAAELYQLAKAGMGADQWSIIYDLPMGGASYGSDGVREITKANLFSVDAVQFAMNPETRLVSVKAQERKEGRTFSAATRSQLIDASAALHEAANDHAVVARKHVNAVRNVADDLATVIQGSEPAYGTDPGTPADGQQEGKRRRKWTMNEWFAYHEKSRALGRGRPSSKRTPPILNSSLQSSDTVSESDLNAALGALRAARMKTEEW